ncbi:MAG: peptide chain release factor 1 [Leptolyngbyaceae cyanobacterium SM2_5_2]|nr:peptide chain release factor 1 [Leptolyngbyaceae cyanobacterium SM2_5_2]
MRNPFWRLKTLPWGTLLLAAAVVVAIATVADMVLAFALGWLLSSLGNQLSAFFQLLLLALPVAAGFGIGALSIVVMERSFRQIYLYTGVLWALVACLALALFVKGFFPIPALVVTMGYNQLIGIVLGIFVVGKRHWR